MKSLIDSILKGKFNESIEVNTNALIFSEDIVKYCKMNHCGKYNTNWTCPSAIGKFDKLKQNVLSYNRVCIINFIYKLNDCFDIYSMDKARDNCNRISYDLINKLKKYKKEFYITLCGSCMLCEHCTYPNNACRHPDMAYPSIEAMGIDVVSTSQNIGLHYYNGKNTITYFIMILYDRKRMLNLEN